MDLISVIVPVYKVEKYLDKCVESIVNQTYKNLEIILVDDGSPDRCPEICDKWASRDDRIKVIHQINGGGGKARNVALDVANGAFVGFVDSDDYIHPRMYEKLMSCMEADADVGECQIIITDSDSARFDHYDNYEATAYSREEAMRLHIEDKLFRQTPPNKLYRKDVISDIRFPIGKLIDDEFWTYRVLGNARKLISIPCKMYAYRQQQGSVMHKRFSLQRLQALEAKCERIEYLALRFPNLLPVAKHNLQMTCMFLGQMSLKYLDKKECAEAFKIIKKIVFDYNLKGNDMRGMSLKNRIWIYCSKISFRGTCTLRNILKKGI